MRKRFIITFGIFFLFIAVCFNSYLFPVVNIGHSLPGFLYFVSTTHAPSKGDVIAFIPPKNIKHYKHIKFLKILAGVEGDVVTFHGLKFFINGEYMGEAKEKTSENLSLEIIGSKVIEKNKVFVFSPHKDSYDSRYKEINTIDRSCIVGTAYRLF